MHRPTTQLEPERYYTRPSWVFVGRQCPFFKINVIYKTTVMLTWTYGSGSYYILLPSDFVLLIPPLAPPPLHPHSDGQPSYPVWYVGAIDPIELAYILTVFFLSPCG